MALLQTRRPAHLAITATAAVAILLIARPASAVDGLRERLNDVRSIHVKGWVYQQIGTEFGDATLAFPTEIFHERPLRSYHTSYGFSFARDRKLDEVTKRLVVSDGEQSMTLDDDEKTATFTPVDKLLSELRIESSIQRRFLQQIREPASAGFKHVGEEIINDVNCTVYEHLDAPGRPLRSRTRIWIDAKTDLPAKAAGYTIERDGAEYIHWEWSEIIINADPPPEMFSFTVPEGYERIEGKQRDAFDAVVGMSGGGGMSANGKSASHLSGANINIDDKAVLYCWSVKTTDKDGTKWFDGQPEFSLDDGDRRPCDEITLRTDKLGERQARWSLIVPRDGRPLNGATMSSIYRLGKNTSAMENRPLVLKPKRLPELIEELQRRTMPPDSNADDIWTLDELRAKIAEKR
jgi:outer membrane lipoprotein-sorting protein